MYQSILSPWRCHTNRYAKNRGFTLVEILVVVLIIGILAAIALPQYKKAIVKIDVTKYASLVPPLTQAHNEWVLTNGRDMEQADVHRFWEEILDNGKAIGFETCKRYSTASFLCFFPGNDSLQQDVQVNFTMAPPYWQHILLYPSKIRGATKTGVIDLYIYFKPTYGYIGASIDVRHPGFNDPQYVRDKELVCEAAKSLPVFKMVCGQRN